MHTKNSHSHKKFKRNSGRRDEIGGEKSRIEIEIRSDTWVGRLWRRWRSLRGSLRRRDVWRLGGLHYHCSSFTAGARESVAEQLRERGEGVVWQSARRNSTRTAPNPKWKLELKMQFFLFLFIINLYILFVCLFIGSSLNAKLNF